MRDRDSTAEDKIQETILRSTPIGAKHQIAQLIADLFEELSWNAQPQRKAWHSESYHPVIFDAVATGPVAFGDEFNSDSVEELISI